MDRYDLVVVGPSALSRSGLRPLAGRAFGPLTIGPSALSDATTKIYIIGYPTKNGGKIWILRDR